MDAKKPYILNGSNLTTKIVADIANNEHIKVEISKESLKRINASRSLLEQFIKNGRVIYGVNTSMGGLVDWLVSTSLANELQENLINAVATNVGKHLPKKVVRASMLVRLNSLARGNSAISQVNFMKLLQMLNCNIYPCIPEKGSLGTSGDLGPLACIALVGCGYWKAEYQGEVISGKEALKSAGLEPMKLDFKEGLSLINGTSVMAGMGAILVEEIDQLISTYQLISSLSFEALKAKHKPFDPVVHRLKEHPGQLLCAENIFSILSDSKMIEKESDIEKKLEEIKNKSVQQTNIPIEDAYSIRCTPQIIGPIIETLKFARGVINNEINSSNDNPLISLEEKEVYHNGHFHGQYLAMVFDYLSISLTVLMNLSERRTDRFLDKNHSNGLPPFLCKENTGLRLGLMGGQFMSTSITAETRSICVPVSTQSLPSTEDFQDIVSLGLVAGRRTREILNNLYYVTAFELMCGCQAADMRGVALLSTATSKLFHKVRKQVPYLDKDIYLTEYIEKIAESISLGTFCQLRSDE